MQNNIDNQTKGVSWKFVLNNNIFLTIMHYLVVKNEIETRLLHEYNVLCILYTYEWNIISY